MVVLEGGEIPLRVLLENNIDLDWIALGIGGNLCHDSNSFREEILTRGASIHAVALSITGDYLRVGMFPKKVVEV